MKLLPKSILIVVAALGFGLFGCNDEPEIPKEEVALEVLPSDLSALKTIHEQLGVDAESYPSHWNPEDMSTWKNAGITLDTITDEESQQNYLAVASITLYLTHKNDFTPEALLSLSSLKDLKVYACSDSYFNGRMIPASVESLLVDRLNPDDPGYIIGVPNDKLILANRKAIFRKLVMHGIDMKSIGCIMSYDAEVDLSHNTLEGNVPSIFGTMLRKSANLSYNKFTGLQWGWEIWSEYNGILSVPNLQNNDFSDIPDYVFESDFWKEHHENFIGNPGYKAPEE